MDNGIFESEFGDLNLIYESNNYEELKNLSEIKQYLDISKYEIKAKHPAVVVLDKSEYKDEIEEFPEYYKVPGIINIYFPNDNKVLNLPFLFDVNLYKTPRITETKKELVIEYQPGDTIIKQKLKLNSLSFNTFRRLLDGHSKFIKSPEQLAAALAEFMNYSIDYVFFEVLAQQVYRCANDVSKPCRLCNYENCTFVGISKLPRKISWLLGMSFERANAAVRDALVEDIPLKYTPFEKIILNY